MSYKGTVNGNHIELDEPVALPSGTRVTVEVAPESQPEKSTLEAVLRLADLFTPEEAEVVEKAAAECRRIDPELWK